MASNNKIRGSSVMFGRDQSWCTSQNRVRVPLPSPAQCPHGAFSKAETGFGFVLQNNGIVDRVPCQSMQTNHFAFALAFNGHFTRPPTRNGVRLECECRAARGVFLVHVMHLADVGFVPRNALENASGVLRD